MDGNLRDPLAVFTSDGNVVSQSRRPKGSDSFDALLLLDPTPLAPDKTEHTSNRNAAKLFAERGPHDIDLPKHPIDKR